MERDPDRKIPEISLEIVGRLRKRGLRNEAGDKEIGTMMLGLLRTNSANSSFRRMHEHQNGNATVAEADLIQ